MDDDRAGEAGERSMTDSAAGSAAAQKPGLSPLILACLAATWLIWGSTYLAIKWALISLPPFFQMGTRFLVAGGLLMAWMRLARKASWPTRVQWRNALWVGTLMLGGGMGSTAYAEQSVESGLAVAFIAVVPIMIAAINMIWKVYPSKLEAAGIAVGLAGVLMLTQGAGFRASPQGLAAIAVACLSWSVGSVMSQRRWKLAPGATGFASEMLCGGCALMLVSLAAGEPAAVASSWPFHAKAVLAWAYLVVFGSLMAFNAYMVLLARVSGGLASSYTFVNPVIAMLLGVWLAGEVVTGYEWLSSAVILLGVILLMSRGWR
jgi:drug/metabolite transporter (DMT)-like permease